eukprot:5647852-Pyramimonas_sp.AAC.1
MLPERRIAGFAGSAVDANASSRLGRSRSKSTAPFPCAGWGPQALPLAMAEAASKCFQAKGRVSGPRQ